LSINSRSASNGVTLYNIFIKHQNPGDDFIFTPSNNFVDVSDMNEAFHVTENTLFKITFQGEFRYFENTNHQYVQIMVNDNLIMGDRVLPNTDQRMSMNWGRNCYRGAGAVLSLTRVAMIYLPPGIYVFNIGVRTEPRDNQSGRVRAELITY
jgi:hypothetical protein